MSRLYRFVVLSLALMLSTACAVNYSTPSASLKINTMVTLPDELAETSGLFCEEEGMVSLNDSGNAPLIFHVNYQGEITKRTRLALTNKDWEAITADPDFYYIADVGNNKGKREQVEIHKVNRSNVNDIKTITLKYTDNNTDNNIPYAHDFDSEAMVKLNNKLLLFSKSWRTGITHIYHVNKAEPIQKLRPFASIEGLPGVVTGVDFDELQQRFVITGYKSDPFGNFATFLAQVSTEFLLLNIWPLDEYKQVEGVCVDGQGLYWFSEEATEGRKASLSSAQVVAK